MGAESTASAELESHGTARSCLHAMRQRLEAWRGLREQRRCLECRKASFWQFDLTNVTKYYLGKGVKTPTPIRHRRRFQDRPGPWLGRPWVPLVWASSVWSAAKPSRRERLVRGARERLLAWRDAFGGMQCGLSAASPHVALIGSWVGGGEGVQEGKIHAHGAPPDNFRGSAPASRAQQLPDGGTGRC